MGVLFKSLSNAKTHLGALYPAIASANQQLKLSPRKSKAETTTTA